MFVGSNRRLKATYRLQSSQLFYRKCESILEVNGLEKAG